MVTRTFWIKPALVVVSLLICVGLFIFHSPQQSAVQSTAPAAHPQPPREYTVDDRVREYGEVVRGRLEPDFRRAEVPYPPTALALIGLKEEKTLQVYGSGHDGTIHFIRSYPILAASGHPGPKLREGDLQVPEGLYRIENLNPNSLYHLALRVNYPNEFDQMMGAKDNRKELGEDIMIHGNAMSAGCLAMGDQAAEDLFVLAALTGTKNIQVILSPVDFRVHNLSPAPEDPSWLSGLYKQVRNELKKYPVAEHP